MIATRRQQKKRKLLEDHPATRTRRRRSYDDLIWEVEPQNDEIYLEAHQKFKWRSTVYFKLKGVWIVDHSHS